MVTYPAFELQPYNDLYVDGQVGSDLVIGSVASAPLQTLNQALTRLRPDKLNRIWLQQGQTFATGAATILETLTVTDCRLELHGFGSGARPVIQASVDGGKCPYQRADPDPLVPAVPGRGPGCPDVHR